MCTSINKSGRVARASVPYSSGSPIWNQTAYDAIGRITAVVAADGNDTTYDYDSGADNSCATPGSRTVSVTNGLSQVQTEFKNALGETTDVYDNACGHIAYDYDTVGNLTDVTGADGAVTSMVYDLSGRKVAMSDPDKGGWEYQYNALGELKRQLDSKSQATDFDYDALGRVTNRRELKNVASLSDTTVTVVNRETTTYRSASPGKGQVASVIYRTGESGTVLQRQDYGYDGLGRPTSVSTTIGASQWTEETTYDQYSRVFQQFDASGDDNGIRVIGNPSHF